jgi:NADH dehydrogenase FAD-containing subunit
LCVHHACWVAVSIISLGGSGPTGLQTAGQLARAARTVRARMAPDGELTALEAALETTYHL